MVLPLSIDPRDYIRYDARFGRVSDVRHSYVEWIAPDLLLVTSNGAEGSEFKFSRLFLVKLKGLQQPPELIDVSGAVEGLVKQTGRDFCSGDAVTWTGSPPP